MKITSLLALGSAAAALLAIPATAQDASPGARPARMAETTRAQAEQSATAMFARLDVNKDSTVNAADRAARQQARFDRLDTDSNGQLSPAEFATRAERGQRAGRRGQRGGGMGRMAEGTTQAQFVAGALATFDRADANKDGAVTREERRAARPQRANRAGGMPPATMQ